MSISKLIKRYKRIEECDPDTDELDEIRDEIENKVKSELDHYRLVITTEVDLGYSIPVSCGIESIIDTLIDNKISLEEHICDIVDENLMMEHGDITDVKLLKDGEEI